MTTVPDTAAATMIVFMGSLLSSFGDRSNAGRGPGAVRLPQVILVMAMWRRIEGACAPLDRLDWLGEFVLQRFHRGGSRFSDNLALFHVAFNLRALDLARDRSSSANKHRAREAGENDRGHGSIPFDALELLPEAI